MLSWLQTEIALQDITNKQPKFRLQVDLEAEYATLRSNRTGTKNIAPHLLRLQGVKAIDLWTDGELYPMDPVSGSPPAFQNIASFLRFVGSGYDGLLGYCRRLYSLFLDEAARRRALESTLENLKVSSTTEIKELNAKVQELLDQIKEHKTKMRDESRSFEQVAENYIRLQYTSRNLRRRIDHLAHLPMGYQVRQRKRKALDLLSKHSGARKRRMHATR